VRICVIFNPTAKGDRAKRFRRHLDEIGANCALKPTLAAGMGRVLAAQAVTEGFDTIAAAGGDGTVNEVLNGIGDAPDGFARARLAVLPLGTINVFARELGVPIRLHRSWEIIRRGRETEIDLPRVEFVNQGRTEHRYFAQLAGSGVDSRAVELVDWQQKRTFGFFAYAVAAFRAMREHALPIQMSAGNETVSGEQVLLGNGRFYAGPLVAFPQADMRDGLLDVCLYPQVKWTTVIACAWGIATGRLSRMGGARHFQSESITLTSPKRAPLELDGEPVGELPATFSVCRRALRVVVP
jgi:YegS/Rv2252/BmrU family lipid kinase